MPRGEHGTASVVCCQLARCRGLGFRTAPGRVQALFVDKADYGEVKKNPSALLPRRAGQ